MSISTDQKLDYLWKKVGYGAAKRDINSVLNATQEGVPSPLLLRGDNVWAKSGDIPGTMPASSSGVVEVYPTTSPIEVSSFDTSARDNRFWNTGEIDWIPPELGSTYVVKVYIHTSGDAANAAANGTQVFATGSGNNDEWFFDYQAGTLNFIGDNLPNGVNFTGKSVYISGARYVGTKGVSVVGAAGSFSDLFVTGISTFEGNVNVGTSITMYSQTGIISATFYGDGSNLTGVGTGAQGVQGLQGVQGVQGLQGLQGNQGVQGLQGLQGLQGQQGLQGLQGNQGVQGLQGLQGNQGTQGLQGRQGTQATQGTQGLQGTQGRQGTQGTQGLQGTQGNQGVQGAQGTQGRQGLQGLQGNQGLRGSPR